MAAKYLHRLCASLLAILIAAFASPVLARIVIPSDYVCPLGKEVFQGDFQAKIYRQMLDDPDDTYVGVDMVMPIVQCPNGFLIAKPRFSKAELAQLAKLITVPKFKELRDRPTFEQYRWVRQQQGADSYELAGLRFLATRERFYSLKLLGSEIDREYLREIAGLAFDSRSQGRWFHAYFRAVNILRENGKFDDAARLLAIINIAKLTPDDPRIAGEAKALARLIAERNESKFPVTLGSAEDVAYSCLDQTEKLSASERNRCASGELQTAMANYCMNRKVRGLEQYAPTGCEQFGRYDDIISGLAAALALLFLALTFRGLNRSETHS